MRCSLSPWKFGLTARFPYNVKYSVTILLRPCSVDTSWIIHDAASCHVSTNFSYLMSSLALDASVCHAMLFLSSLLCPDKREQLESNAPKGLHCLYTTRTGNRLDTGTGTIIEQVCYWNNNQLLIFSPHCIVFLSLYFSFCLYFPPQCIRSCFATSWVWLVGGRGLQIFISYWNPFQKSNSAPAIRICTCSCFFLFFCFF